MSEYSKSAASPYDAGNECPNASTVPLALPISNTGANPNAAPARDPRFPRRSLYELAVMEGVPQIVELLARHGATRSTPALDDVNVTYYLPTARILLKEKVND